MLYSPFHIKSKFQSKCNQEEWSKISQILTFKNIWSLDFIKTAHVTRDSKFYVDKETAIKLIDYLNEIVNKSLSINDIISEQNGPIVIFDSLDYESLTRDIKQYFSSEEGMFARETAKQEKKDLRENERQFAGLFKTSIPTNYKDKHIVSLDFEFVSQKETCTITEIGIAQYKNGQQSHFHFIVEDGTFVKDKTTIKPFVFGKTIAIKQADIRELIENFCSDADYVVGHNIRSEYYVLLNNYNYNMLEDKSYTLLDTEHNFCHNFRIEGEIPKLSVSLEKVCRHLKIKAENLHNAGNDSAYTLKVLLDMGNRIEKKKQKKKKFIHLKTVSS